MTRESSVVEWDSPFRFTIRTRAQRKAQSAAYPLATVRYLHVGIPPHPSQQKANVYIVAFTLDSDGHGRTGDRNHAATHSFRLQAKWSRIAILVQGRDIAIHSRHLSHVEFRRLTLCPVFCIHECTVVECQQRAQSKQRLVLGNVVVPAYEVGEICFTFDFVLFRQWCGWWLIDTVHIAFRSYLVHPTPVHPVRPVPTWNGKVRLPRCPAHDR